MVWLSEKLFCGARKHGWKRREADNSPVADGRLRTRAPASVAIMAEWTIELSFLCRQTRSYPPKAPCKRSFSTATES